MKTMELPVARLLASRRDQGLPERVTDPRVLTRLAALLATTTRKETA